MGYKCDDDLRKLLDPKTGTALPNVSSEQLAAAREAVRQTLFATNEWSNDDAVCKDNLQIINDTYDHVYRNTDYGRELFCGRMIGIILDLIRTKRIQAPPPEPEPPAPEPSKDSRGVLLSEIPAEVEKDINSTTVTTREIHAKRRASIAYDLAFVAATRMQPGQPKPTGSISRELEEFARDWNSMSGTPRLVNGLYTIGAKQFRPEQFDLMLAKASEAQLIR